MNLNLGIDVGNGYTKYQGKRFASKVKNGVLSKVTRASRKEVHQVKYKGLDYVVGDGGTFTGEDRYFSDNYLICLLTGVALAGKEQGATNPLNVNLVVGLPVDYYNGQAEDLKGHLSKNTTHEITVDDTYYVIEFKTINVFVEGAWTIKEDTDAHVITIDVGAGTVNAIEWEDKAIVNKFTFSQAFYKMHKDIAEYLNEKHGTRLMPEDAEKLVGKKEMDTKTGTVNIEEIDNIVKTTIDNMATTIEQSFTVDTAKRIVVFGGGAKDTFAHWKQKFPKAELTENNQYTNQEVYTSVCRALNE